MRVLIIDDEVNIRKVTAAALEGMGHESADAADGCAALEQLATAHFNLAFLDINLGNENGVELLPKLLESDPGLEVVVVTGQPTSENARAARLAGAVDFLAKPFTPDQIRKVLRGFSGRHQELVPAFG